MLQPDRLDVEVKSFTIMLRQAKEAIGRDFPWYPYETLANISLLRPIFERNSLETLINNGAVLDIGAADGELAFFLESLGYQVGILDHAPTNFNQLQGAKALRDQLGSSVTIDDVDLDSYFQLPMQNYNLVIFLGILYHLKNPFYVLERLAKSARHLLVSTRVARLAPNGDRLQDVSVAYLVGPSELNNDSTNYWIFSETGLRQIFRRTGWDIVTFLTVGDTIASDPVSKNHDERAFALLRSRAS